MKENLNTIPRNQKSLNLTLISQRNWRSKMDDFFENLNLKITKSKDEIKLNY